MDPLSAFRLDGRVVVLTGASSGLGLGFARAIAAVGGAVVLGARRLDRLQGVADALTAEGATVRTKATDVSEPDSCAALVQHAMDELGRVDGLVNNAGLGGVVPASRETVQGFRSVLDVNLSGAFWMAQACGAVMAPGSSIVNVASIAGLIAIPHPQAAYAASKASLIGLTRDLAAQWSGRKGIRVNALCPGYFRTEMLEGGEEQIEAEILARAMLKRFGEQHELDAALLFLLSDASSYVCGTTLAVDGGLSAL